MTSAERKRRQRQGIITISLRVERKLAAEAFEVETREEIQAKAQEIFDSLIADEISRRREVVPPVTFRDGVLVLRDGKWFVK